MPHYSIFTCCNQVSQISHLVSPTTWLYHCHASFFNIYQFATMYHTCYHQLRDCTTATPHYSIFTCLPPCITDITPVITNYMIVPLPLLIIQYLPVCHQLSQISHLLSPTTGFYHCHASLFNIYLFATSYHRYHTCYHQLHDCTTVMPHHSIFTCLPPGITDITPVITNYMTVPLSCLINQYLPVWHQVSQIPHLLSPTTWLYHCHASSFNIYLFGTRYHRYHTCYHQQHDCTTVTPHHSIFICLAPGITDITPVITNNMTVPLPCIIIQCLPVWHQISQISHLLSPTTWLYHCHASLFNIYLFGTRYHRYHTCYHLQHDCTTVMPHHSIFTCFAPGITDITPVITNYMTVALSRLII